MDAVIAMTPGPVHIPRRVGRPAIFDKRLKRTFMMDGDSDAILTRKAKELGCSRSDILVQAIRSFDRRHKADK